MKNSASALIVLVLAVSTDLRAQQLSMKWGLENTWSYAETSRSKKEDAASKSQSKTKEYRAFAFNSNKEVVEPMLKCFDRHFDLWERYKIESKPASSYQPPRGSDGNNGMNQAEFLAYKAKNDPFCIEQFKKQAPTLYFDFVADSADQYVLEAIEVTTLKFSEYKGGGFALGEAWYDISLPHNVGTKTYDVQHRLTFSGQGQAQLRFWSDNFYASEGWIAPMGEYTIDIQFVFSVKGKKVTASTGPFKIDV